MTPQKADFAERYGTLVNSMPEVANIRRKHTVIFYI